MPNLHIKNFFSFKDCSIDLQPKVNMWVGLKESGKSKLLDGLKISEKRLTGTDVLKDYIQMSNNRFIHLLNKIIFNNDG